MSADGPIGPIEARWRGPKGDKGEPGQAGLSPRLRRALVALFLLPSLIAVVAVVGVARTQHGQDQTVRKLDRTVAKLRREVTAECAFNSDLAPLPVAAGPTGKASLLGVKIVADSRVAWHREGCPGRLVRASPSFARWARFYHLPTG